MRGCLALGLFLSTACGSTASDQNQKKVRLDYLLHNTLIDENSQVIEGVQICADGRDDIPCVTTDSLGVADLALPKNTELYVSYSMPGFIPKLRLFRSGEEPEKGLGAWLMQRRTWFEDILMKAGALPGAVDIDGNGLLGLQTGRIPNLEFAFEPPSPNIFGPFFFCVNPPLLEFCAQASENDAGVAAFANLPPGQYRGIISKVGLTCTPDAFACQDGTPGCVEMELRPGTVTHAGMHCE